MNYRFPFDIEQQIAALTNVYRAGMNLPALKESSLAADLREAPLAQEGDHGNRKGCGVQIKQSGGDLTPGLHVVIGPVESLDHEVYVDAVPTESLLKPKPEQRG